MRKPIIAIDGYSSTGKSSISKEIAKRLDIIHLDTGALYRGITFFALENCVKDGVIDFENLFSRFIEVHLEFHKKENSLVLYLNGRDISTEIRTQRISDNVSQIAKQSEVREFLLHTQREIARTGGVILDGRDIGSVVLPDADYKFFLTASVDKRTERRYKELKEMGMETSMKEVRENLLTRDKIDSEREIAPLIQLEDAILLDNSDIDKEQTIELILSYIK